MATSSRFLLPKCLTTAAFWRGKISFLVLLAVAGCAHRSPPLPVSARLFQFGADNFAFANELVWEYRFEGTRSLHQRRTPPPNYTHHCFVVARSALQFFQHARFDPGAPRTNENAYKLLIKRVVSSSPRRRDSERIVIPGYENLYAFSQDYENLLKENCGSALQSYCQRGHWRMVLPFTRNHQARICQQLMQELGAKGSPVVHLVRFPQLTINHAVLLFGYRNDDAGVLFEAYDPNNPKEPVLLRYSRRQKSFQFDRNHYFKGGKVDVYEIYHAWNY